MENEQKSLDPLKGTVEYKISVDIPADSKEYLAFLEANRRRELAREETGGPDPEAEATYLEAVERVDKLAQAIYSLIK